ncbi:hypothetical protein EH93P2_00041 [Enterococcus phage EH93P2]|nr:hypothetical protein EH93P1_00083 [Enterococcus phage EH93P1]WAX15923.1 hypothetical protein EH93P2_00041 [Enterococcus phage EH93P2]
MTTFKKGDLVECINTKDYLGITKGKKYIVRIAGEDYLLITDDDLRNGYPYEPECFELSQVEAGDYFCSKNDGNIYLCMSDAQTSIGDVLYLTHNTAFLDWQVEPYVWHGGLKEGDLVEIIDNGSDAYKSRGELYRSGDRAYVRSVHKTDVQLESLDGFYGASYMQERFLKLVYRRNNTAVKNDSLRELIEPFSVDDEAQEILDTLEDIPTDVIEEYLELRKKEEDIEDRRTKAKLKVTFADNDLKDIRKEMKELFK